MKIAIAIRFGIFACLLINVYTINDPNVAELAQLAEEASNDTFINVCDQTNTNNSFIYCYGRLLAAVNIHKLFDDSKYFVDMPMKFDPEIVHQKFDERFGQYKLEDIDRSELKVFVDEYFEPAGNELESCQLKEWKENPRKLMKIQDPILRNWALKLHEIWKLLCRKMKSNENPKRTSLIYVPEEFIAPGGRFREFYYWDAYWIIKGLAASELYNSIKKMIINFATVVDRYGFIPNGGRIYYLARSQPPLLIPMVYEYYELTRDLEFVQKILPTLLKEYEFWENNRVINVTLNEGEEFSVFYYNSKSNVPRPESFRVDIIHASKLPSNERKKFYKDIASAAESGWDFSSRWFKDSFNIETIETTDILPIDLNAFICWNLNILQYLLEHAGDLSKSKIFAEKRAILRLAMLKVFYNEAEGVWFDYNMRTKSHNSNFYTSIAVPLFGQCYQPLNLGRPQQIVNYMNKTGVYDYPNGIPISLVKGTQQQWDFPNSWSPTNHMIIEGMRKSSNPVVQEQAYRLAKKWVLGNFRVFQETGHMWEKYNVNETASKPGSGGEYAVQDGFGWSNGVILDLLTTYYNRMRIEPGDLEPDNNVIHKGPKTTSPPETVTGSASKQISTQSTLIPILIASIFYIHKVMC